MKKSKHFALAAVAFSISSVGFMAGGYPGMSGALGVLTLAYAALAWRSRVQERTLPDDIQGRCGEDGWHRI